MDKINERLQELYQRREITQKLVDKRAKEFAAAFAEYRAETTPLAAFKLSMAQESYEQYARELSAIKAQISEFEI